jgi:hypothetical protein
MWHPKPTEKEKPQSVPSEARFEVENPGMEIKKNH